MNTKALWMTTLAFLCAGTVNAQVVNTGYAQCGTACGSPGCCNSGCCNGNGGGCQNSMYTCQNWCNGNCCNNGGSCFDGSCFGGGCLGGGCSLGLTSCDHCPLGIGCDNSSCLTNGCLSQHCATKAYPDAGWAPPARMPVNRDGIWYQNWLPQTAYGNPGGGFVGVYPQVYQPTDTTQMGYNYSKVPTWQTRTDRIPPVPRPSAFHNRSCPGNSGYCGFSGGYVSGCPTGNCQMSAASFPSVQPMTSQPIQVAGGNRQVVRAASAKKKSFFSLTRLTNLFD